MGVQAINAEIKRFIQIGRDMIPPKLFSVKKGREMAHSFFHNGLSGVL